MSRITLQEIAELAALPGVSRDAVVNFLSTLDDQSQGEALANLEIDARAYGWNTQTGRAIQLGIMLRGEPRERI